ncbi:hypothetical protein [Methylogaea oryzae]|nr:hypothetical protein [Methylogaea oryzae]
MRASFAALLLASSMAGAATNNQEDFKPEVLYQDADYIASHKHVPLAASSASSQQSASKQEVSSAVAEKTASQGSDAMSQNYWLGLVIVGLGGLIFWSSKRSRSAEAPAYSAPVAQAGSSELTGVARYLAQTGGAVEAATGVARYLKAREESGASVASAALTGVARYLQNRG